MSKTCEAVVVSDPADLVRLRPEWERLAARSSGRRFCRTPTWSLAWWSVFGGGGRRLQAIVVRDRGEVIGLFLLLVRRHWHRGAIPLLRLEQVASGEAQADEIVSEYLGPLAVAGRERDVADALVGHLDRSQRSWNEAVLTALDGHSPTVVALEAALTERGLLSERRVSTECPFIALPQRWEDYLASLSSEHRYVIKRSLRDFERWAGADHAVEVLRAHHDLPRAKTILYDLHERRWREGAQTGVFGSEKFRQFHDLVMPELLDREELDLRWLVVRGRPIAVNYSVVHDNCVFFYQTGRATDLPKDVRPGIVLHAHAIRAAIEAGRREYDFLGGDGRYKRQLATHYRPLIDLRLSHRSLPVAARNAVENTVALVRRARAGMPVGRAVPTSDSTRPAPPNPR